MKKIYLIKETLSRSFSRPKPVRNYVFRKLTLTCHYEKLAFQKTAGSFVNNNVKLFHEKWKEQGNQSLNAAFTPWER